MTQEQLAAELDTAVRNVQRIESGVQNLTLLTIARIAAAIGLTPYELLNGRR
jgi:transcriptional regulator with XRE-family HTH domain